MASASHHLLLLLSVSVLLISATARPCKTILFISSSSSFSLTESPQRTRYLTFFLTQQIQPTRFQNPMFIDRIEPQHPKPAFDGASIRDRTVDIMSVVGALLFGVGCGALTAAVMYFVWSMCSGNRFDYGESDEEACKDVEDDVYNPKKMGYVAIPADTPLKQVA